MKTRSHLPLWLYFAGMIFAITAIAGIVMVIFALLLNRSGYFGHPSGSGALPLLALLALSIILGTVVSLFVAEKILRPVTDFSKISQEVAKGNFTVRADDTNRVREIAQLGHNLNLMIDELGAMKTLGSDFISNVSHEFNTPLTTIEGYATLLQDPGLSAEDHAEYVTLIISSTRQLGRLSGDILQLSNLERDGILLEKQSFRLDEQIRRSVLMYETQWSEKDLQLHIDLPHTEHIGNEHLLMHVWGNLIGNAVKFTPAGGSISVELVPGFDGVTVRITDSGCGMSPDEMRRVFDKFYQGDGSRQSQGNGLGLTLVKRIVDLSGGEISVASVQGVGTTFTVTLPG